MGLYSHFSLESNWNDGLFGFLNPHNVCLSRKVVIQCDFVFQYPTDNEHNTYIYICI